MSDHEWVRRAVRFPPNDTGVLLPRRDRKTAALGVTMFTASKRKALAVQWAAWTWIRVFGSGLLPGPEESVSLTFLPEITQALGMPDGGLTSGAVYARRDTVRTGLTMVASGRSGPVVLKIRPSGEKLDREQQLLGLVRSAAPTSFAVPRPLGSGALADGRAWSAQEMVFRSPHRPCTRLPSSLPVELSRVLESVRDTVEPGPSNWEPAHGDLTPWNLRVAIDGSLWLLDWEDVCLAPPGADLAYFHAALGVVRPRRRMESIDSESAAFWSDRIRARLDAGHPEGPNLTMLARLEQAVN